MSKMEENAKWLHEKNLKTYLEKIFNEKFIHNKQIPNSGLRYRPDYRNEKLKLIVEFDGPRHYTSAKTVFLDKKKDKLYSDLGYKVVRIPYFIQIETRTVETLFGIKKDIPQVYPHGFNEDKVVLPADFCSVGLDRFKQEIKVFYKVREDILLTLETKMSEVEKDAEVLPYELFECFYKEVAIYELGSSPQSYIYQMLELMSNGEDDLMEFGNVLCEFVSDIIGEVGRDFISKLHPAIQTFIAQHEDGEEVFTESYKDVKSQYNYARKRLEALDRWGIYDDLLK